MMMRHLTRVTRRRLARLLAACLLLAGGLGAAGLLTAGPAGAAACSGAVPAGTSCTDTGTLVLTAGALTLTSPTALGWAGTLNGLDQQLVDPTSAHQSYLVNDATGSGAGWHVTVSATTFTTGPISLANAGPGTLAVQGVTGAGTGVTAYNYQGLAIVTVDPGQLAPGL